MSPEDKSTLRKVASIAVLAGATGVVWYALQRLLPAWLFWGVWCFWVVGCFTASVYLAWDTHRLQRSRVELLQNLQRAKVVSDFIVGEVRINRPRPPTVH